MWPSWPQACMWPGLEEQNSTPLFSVMGRASMSARMAVAGPPGSRPQAASTSKKAATQLSQGVVTSQERPSRTLRT